MTRSSPAVLEEVPTKRISAPTPMPNRAGRRASLTRQMSDTLNQFRETREGGGSSPTSPSLDERMEPDSPDVDLVSKVQGATERASDLKKQLEDYKAMSEADRSSMGDREQGQRGGVAIDARGA